MSGDHAVPDPAVSLERLRAAVALALREHIDVVDPLARLCQACVQLLPVDGASVSLMTGTDQRETIYASDAVVDHIETLQFSLGEGPCFEAFTTGRPVLVTDLAADAATAWPVFAAQMADRPVGAIFAFPLVHGAARVGAMDLYRTRPGWLTPPELAIALQVADIAAAALIGPPAAGPGAEIDEEWLASLPFHREHVHQATGMLIAEHRVPAGQALALLRGYAFATGRLVDEVAADLVNRRLHPREIAQ
ncbi:GAF and ANTAR domain-containing protein [Actinokineospora inagensis]|uniref:GAF and ANTAR domain-containing protein n=1 Tax=Actinokineospora inagensis TaxID=103730 RepID=UPI0003FA623F|nr:GAF and ANTAR domain-containing protein [Actinokineospora inagensis]